MKRSTRRRTRLQDKSPYKGTGRYLQYLRCPCCGKLARGQAIGNAGNHQLSMSRVVGRIPGYRKGFEWKHEFPSRDMLESLSLALHQAQAQVDAALAALNRVQFDESAWKTMIEKSHVEVSNDRQEVKGERARIGERVSLGGKVHIGSERVHATMSARSL
jgi:hypothetical protein